MYVECLTIAYSNKVSQKKQPWRNGAVDKQITLQHDQEPRLHHQLSRMRTSLKLNVGSKTDSANICTPRPNESGAVWPSPHSDTQRCTYWCQLSALQATISGLPRCKNPSTFWLCFPLFVMVLGSILLTSFFLCFTSLVSITGSYTEDETTFHYIKRVLVQTLHYYWWRNGQ